MHADRLPAPRSAGCAAVDGHAYVFLPLPLVTALPVHINGFFEISENRRELWLGTDMTGAGRLRALWYEHMPVFSCRVYMTEGMCDKCTCLWTCVSSAYVALSHVDVYNGTRGAKF